MMKVDKIVIFSWSLGGFCVICKISQSLVPLHILSWKKDKTIFSAVWQSLSQSLSWDLVSSCFCSWASALGEWLVLRQLRQFIHSLQPSSISSTPRCQKIFPLLPPANLSLWSMCAPAWCLSTLSGATLALSCSIFMDLFYWLTKQFFSVYNKHVADELGSEHPLICSPSSIPSPIWRRS